MGKTTPLGTTAEDANHLFNAPAKNEDDKVGVFTTPQTLATFPGATAAVSVVWQVLTRADERLSNVFVPIGISLFVGLIIYLLTVRKGTIWRRTLAEIGIALINSFMIAAAVLGISSIKPETSSRNKEDRPPLSAVSQNSPVPDTPQPVGEQLSCELPENAESTSAERLTKIIESCTTDITNNPQNVTAIFTRGLLYHNRKNTGDYGKAIDDYSKVIDSDRAGNISRPDVYQNRGNALYERRETGDLEQAIQDYKSALSTLDNTKENKNKRFDLMLDLGYAHYALGNQNGAVRTFRQICTEDPDSSSCLKAKGEIGRMGR